SFEGKESENTQNFLREVERYIYLNRIMDEVMKVVIFSTFIYAGSQADLWWNGLDASKKTTWQDVKKEFENQWPAIVKSQLDYQKELLALRLKEEDVGEQIMVAGVSTWLHLHYHRHLQKLVQDAGVMNAPVFIHQVREGLPCVIRDLTSPSPATWTAFLDEIKGANVDVIQDKARREKEKREVEKMQNERITRLENRQSDPVEVLPLIQTVNKVSQAAPMQPRANNSPQLNHLPSNQNTQGQQPRGQLPMQEERELMRVRINELTHHPDTEGGQAAYEEQIHQWEAQWGRGARCMEQTPYPLTLGTVQICSGECFRCGAHGHIGRECQIPVNDQLPKNESIWRGLSTRTLGTFNRAMALQINIMFDNAYGGEQGKGRGLSV
ncbi:hypothetical protein BDR04DRAFT_1036925, partial [Suillus decipiens]